jgi:hypothetical protein
MSIAYAQKVSSEQPFSAEDQFQALSAEDQFQAPVSK